MSILTIDVEGLAELYIESLVEAESSFPAHTF
jgi:hypothetical protein